jgi:hypothetical protein
MHVSRICSNYAEYGMSHCEQDLGRTRWFSIITKGFLMVHASVVICTHNSRLIYLRRVLEALRSQTLPLEQWELLLIDNATVKR